MSLGRCWDTGYGDTSHPWSKLAAFYAELEQSNPAFHDPASLGRRIAASRFARAGLCGMQSHSDLIVGLSRYILDNPHLRIAYDFHGRFRFEYQDGSVHSWTRTVPADDAYPLFERFVTKYARWFRESSPG